MVAGMMTACFLWWRRPRRNEVHDGSQDKDDVIYYEISEDPTSKKRKKRKLKKKVSEKKAECQNEVEAVAVDTAPDIITAHDSDSIYETLDKKRWSRDQKGFVLVRGDNSTADVGAVSGRESPPLDTKPGDRTYDHLDGFDGRKDRPERHSGSACSQRGSGGDGWQSESAARRGSSQRMSSGSREVSVTSLAELASQTGAGGKKIVCQLTMLGVMEDGKPVPIQSPRVSKTYFLLEPETQSDAASDWVGISPKTRFRIRDDRPAPAPDSARKDCRDTPSTPDYYILEAIGDRDSICDALQSDLLHSAPCRDSAAGEGDWCSAPTSARCPTLQVYKESRSISCPMEQSAPFLGSSPRRLRPDQLDFKRSLSSPNPAQQQSPEVSPRDRKLDPVFLQQRVEEEMRALGIFPGGSSAQAPCSDVRRVSDVSDANDEEHNDEEHNDEEGCPPETKVEEARRRVSRSEYFLLEAAAKENDEGDDKFQPKLPPRRHRAGATPTTPDFEAGSSRFAFQRQISQGLPPRLPERNPNMKMHSRSKSETRMLLTSGGSAESASSPGEEDSGPVIVSLKKNKTADSHSKVVSPDNEPSDAFRPRLQTAPNRTVRCGGKVPK